MQLHGAYRLDQNGNITELTEEYLRLHKKRIPEVEAVLLKCRERQEETYSPRQNEARQ